MSTYWFENNSMKIKYKILKNATPKLEIYFFLKGGTKMHLACYYARLQKYMLRSNQTSICKDKISKAKSAL